MIRVHPDFSDVDTADAAAVCARIMRELTRVPAFPFQLPDGSLPVVVVLPRWSVATQMNVMRHPRDPMSHRSLAQYMLDTYACLGLHSFTSDGESDDEVREAEADKRLVDLLISHPDAHMRGGWVRESMPSRLPAEEVAAVCGIDPGDLEPVT